jgi:hypothetical protein
LAKFITDEISRSYVLDLCAERGNLSRKEFGVGLGPLVADAILLERDSIPISLSYEACSDKRSVKKMKGYSSIRTADGANRFHRTQLTTKTVMNTKNRAVPMKRAKRSATSPNRSAS